MGAFHGYMTLMVLIVLFASTLLMIVVTSYLIVRASKTTLPSYGINKKSELLKSNPVDGSLMSNFVDNLDQHSKMLLLLVGLLLQFDQMMVHSVRRFITSAVGKFATFVLKGCWSWGAPWLTFLIFSLLLVC